MIHLKAFAVGACALTMIICIPIAVICLIAFYPKVFLGIIFCLISWVGGLLVLERKANE